MATLPVGEHISAEAYRSLRGKRVYTEQMFFFFLKKNDNYNIFLNLLIGFLYTKNVYDYSINFGARPLIETKTKINEYFETD